MHLDTVQHGYACCKPLLHITLATPATIHPCTTLPTSEHVVVMCYSRLAIHQPVCSYCKQARPRAKPDLVLGVCSDLKCHGCTAVPAGVCAAKAVSDYMVKLQQLLHARSSPMRGQAGLFERLLWAIGKAPMTCWEGPQREGPPWKGPQWEGFSMGRLPTGVHAQP